MLPVDASVIRQEGKQQNRQRIHLCYFLNENRMKQVKVSDRHTAEYGTAQNYIYAQDQGADVILRITQKNFCLYDADGKKFP